MATAAEESRSGQADARWPRMSPAAYCRFTLAAALALAAIIVTGALVRLTGSGLGCPDWPQCNQSRFVSVSSGHEAIEQLNRLFTGVVAVAVILAVLGSIIRVPRRRDLTFLSLGLVGGVIGQIVLGGITVLTDLNPIAVQGHFVFSILILTNALVLHRRAAEPPGPYRPTVPAAVRGQVLVAIGLLGLAIVGGTVVTGTGPHGGDEDARRFDLAITTVARVHSATVIATVLALVLLAGRIRRGAAWATLGDPLTAVVVALVVQGAIGYAQYASDVPVPLVALHIVGVVVAWWLACQLVFATREVTFPEQLAQSDAQGLLRAERSPKATAGSRGQSMLAGSSGASTSEPPEAQRTPAKQSQSQRAALGSDS